MGHFPTLLLLWVAMALVHLVGTQEGKTLADNQPEEVRGDLSRDLELQEEEEEAVLALNQHTFGQALQEYQLLLVLFYAPWSELCQALAPEYAKAAALLKEEAAAATLRLAKVDAMEELELKQEFGIAGYPAFKLFREGNRTHPTDYTGQREAEAIVTWLRRKAGPSALLLTSEAEATAFLDDNAVAVIGFFHDLQSEDVRLFYEVARDVSDVPMALTDCPELFRKYGISGGKHPCALFQDEVNADVPRADFPVDEDLGLEAAELAHFLAVQSLELVMEFTNQNSSKIFGAKIPNHLLLFINKTVESQLQLLGGFQGAASAFRGQVLFVLADVHGEGARLLHFFGLKSHEVPALRFIHIETNKKYRLSTEEGLSSPAISAFCQGVLEGKVQPHLMSEELPGDWDQRLVKVLVGHNFEQVALDETKDVFVKFYAPWCPHSKAMAPIWEELGKKYQDHANIIIAEMDATTNEVADLPIRAYPTLYYFPSGQGRKMTEYRGTRDLESFSRFLESGGEPPPQEEPVEPETPEELKENQTRPLGPQESRDEL
ncbi:protein disulfide-isomerase A2 [Sceloporus undulatus]|uniref:protein disulfide-isomerase A2 n=1 Tax=Sceloporus undulatus TaxID=8520 RepID=UPI001C4CEA16|nr:protein disulfide-isomerase A2 [Sceloporus undulatus]